MDRVSRFVLLCVAFVCPLLVWAGDFSFDPTMKFRIASCLNLNGSLALGENHGKNTPVCVTTTNTTDEDCYWYIYEYKTNKYAIRNAKSGEFIVIDDVRSETPFRRYMHLEKSVKNDSALWTIGQQSDGSFYFQSVAAPNYCFNLRTSNYALGAYREGGTPSASNEMFYLYKENGSVYNSYNDINKSCGVDDNGFYWTNVGIECPVAYTTDDSNPIYYQIKNVRSGNYLMPDSYVAQSIDVASRRFYFKEAQEGVQIFVEGNGFVSGELPNVMSTSSSDVKVESGAPGKDDHVWGISYCDDESYAGYSIGVVACSKNASSNPRLSSGAVYWNDYFGEGLCFYEVDAGSTFVFVSDDIRHRDHLCGYGLVIPAETLPNVDPVAPDNPDDPDNPTDNSEVEPIVGSITHVYRADGKIDAIPDIYVENVSFDNDSVVVTTKNGGPRYSYRDYEVDSVSSCRPANLPVFGSFKFNNKFNPHLISDAMGVFYGDTLVTLNPICIGKRLRPSFKVDDDVEVFIGNRLQQSKVTRTRYDKDVVYTLARRGHRVLRRTLDGDYVVYPYGRETRVSVDFATDHSTGEYKVPTVYITTDDGTMITSKSYYWDAKITIDGAGVFPDMPETAMQIKGRGNSSWTSTGKAPYHMKFATAVKPLGLTKGKHWNLIANAQTRSMTSNAVAMKMAQLVETAGYNHEIPIELYINGQYRGSYNLTEKIGFANNSIDLVDETYAAMLELDSYYDEAYKFRTSKYNLPVNIKEPDLSEGVSPLTSLHINENFNRVTTALYNDEDMSNYLDLDYLARFLFVDEYAFNSEFMHPKSTFCYNENVMNSDSKYIFGPVWDFDWSYGYQYTGNYFTYSPEVDFWNSVSMEATQWTRDMRYCGENFNKVYYNLWHRFMNDGSLEELIEFCQDYYDFAAESFSHDNTKWGRGDADTYAGVTSNAKNWLKQRAEYIYNYMSNTLGYADKGYLETVKDDVVVGDVNGDGVVTTADLVCVLSYILGIAVEEFDYNQADTDSNDMITIGDALNIRDLIVAESINSSRFYGLPEADAVVRSGAALHGVSGVSIPLTIVVNEGNYSGVQFDLRVPRGMVIEDLDISKSIPDFDLSVMPLDRSTTTSEIANDYYRVSIYASANRVLPRGKSELNLVLAWGEADKSEGLYNVSLSNVMFVNSNGEDERSAAQSSQFCVEAPTGINEFATLVAQDNNKLTFSTTENTVVAIYGVDGKLYRLYELGIGNTMLTLPRGVYLVNKQKIVVH
ncbi:MAG: CotH kinase family protein [Prevotellaceae bacterium]|nr:CotH kinase family protein [Prevotellaceae bacterium]